MTYDVLSGTLSLYTTTTPTPSGFLDTSSYPASCSLAFKQHGASGRNIQHARYVQHAASTCENICYEHSRSAQYVGLWTKFTMSSDYMHA